MVSQSTFSLLNAIDNLVESIDALNEILNRRRVPFETFPGGCRASPDNPLSLHVRLFDLCNLFFDLCNLFLDLCKLFPEFGEFSVEMATSDCGVILDVMNA